MAWKTLDDMDLDGKVVLTRVDINVPVEDGKVTDATRIERIVPTVRDILARGGKPVLLETAMGTTDGVTPAPTNMWNVRTAGHTKLDAR